MATDRVSRMAIMAAVGLLLPSERRDLVSQ
jgi:hypothetical protein